MPPELKRWVQGPRGWCSGAGAHADLLRDPGLILVPQGTAELSRVEPELQEVLDPAIFGVPHRVRQPTQEIGGTSAL